MDIIAAAFVGINQVICGHPFDTAKVLIQNNKKWTGIPFKDYYRGWRFPLVSSTIFNCTVFPIYERTLPYTKNHFESGFLAGIAVAPAVFGFEIGKIHRQTKQPLTYHTFRYAKGIYTTFTRESIAMASYFGVYYQCRKKNLHPLIGGALAGLANWTITYPIDVIKSRQIAQNLTIQQALRLGHLWRGYPICAIRAIIVNAMNFWVYEISKKSFSKK